MTVIGDRLSWKVNSQRTRATKGPLMTVKHPDGHYTRMHEADAIEAGLIPARAKAAPAPGNKIAPMPENKSAAPAPENVPTDDFSTIQGVGRASARSLVAQGVTTFAGLRTADLDTLNLAPSVKAAIEAWRG